MATPIPSPYRSHEFQRGRGRTPKDGNPKCRCGKRKDDSVHIPRRAVPLLEEDVLEMIERRMVAEKGLDYSKETDNISRLDLDKELKDLDL